MRPLRPAWQNTMDAAERAESLKAQATLIRRSVVEMIGRARLGHIGGDFSVSDILTTLFFAVLDLDPDGPECAAARPLHPQQGPLRGGALLDLGDARLLSGRRAQDLH